MPHLQDIANIWAELKDRRDNTNLARELLGRLWPNRFYELPSIDQPAVRDLLLMKVLFDYQNSLLRYRPPGQHALSVDDFLDCLDYLSKTMNEIFTRQGIDTKVRKGFAQILRQSFMSGFRVTLLAIDQLSQSDISQRPMYASLLMPIISSWPEVEPIDRDWLVRIFYAATEHMKGNHDQGIPLCPHYTTLQVPDREKFIRFTYDPSESVGVAVRCVAEKCPHLCHNILCIMEARSMVLAAFYAHLIEKQQELLPDVNNQTADEDTTWTALQSDEKEICSRWTAIMHALQSPPNSMGGNSNATKKFIDFLDELDPGPPLAISASIDHREIMRWTGPALAALPQTEYNSVSRTYSKVCEGLRLRKRAVFDTDGILQKTLNQVHDFTQSWIPHAYQRLNRLPVAVSTSRNLIYQLGCSDLHPISYEDLRSRLDEATRITLASYPDTIDIHIPCPFHPKQIYVHKARRVTPLQQITELLYRTIETNSDPQIDSTESQTDTSLPLLEESGNDSAESVPSESSLKPSTPVNRVLPRIIPPLPRVKSEQSPIINASPGRSSVGSLWSASTSSKAAGVATAENLSSTPRNGILVDLVNEKLIPRHGLRESMSYLFFAHIPTVLIWFKQGTQVIIHDFADEQNHVFPTLDPIDKIATGSNYYAASSVKGKASVVRIYERDTGESIRTIPAINGTVLCMALSTNDRFVAIGCGRKVWVYDLEEARLYEHVLPQSRTRTGTSTSSSSASKDSEAQPHVTSQKISFTSSGERYIVVTRYNNGRVYSHLISFMQDPYTCEKLQSITIPAGYPLDYGLTSVHLDDESTLACVTSFTSKGHVTMLSSESYDNSDPYATVTPPTMTAKKLEDSALGTQIQCSARAPGSFRILLVNHNNDVFRIQRLMGSSVWDVKRVMRPWPKKSLARNNNTVAITMLDDETAYLFWVNLDSSKRPWTLIPVKNIGS